MRILFFLLLFVLFHINGRGQDIYKSIRSYDTVLPGGIRYGDRLMHEANIYKIADQYGEINSRKETIAFIEKGKINVDKDFYFSISSPSRDTFIFFYRKKVTIKDLVKDQFNTSYIFRDTQINSYCDINKLPVLYYRIYLVKNNKTVIISKKCGIWMSDQHDEMQRNKQYVCEFLANKFYYIPLGLDKNPEFWNYVKSEIIW